MQEYYRGQYDDSSKTDKKAKRWVYASIISGVILIVGVITLAIVSQAIVYGVVFGRAGDYDDDKY